MSAFFIIRPGGGGNWCYQGGSRLFRHLQNLTNSSRLSSPTRPGRLHPPQIPPYSLLTLPASSGCSKQHLQPTKVAESNQNIFLTHKIVFASKVNEDLYDSHGDLGNWRWLCKGRGLSQSLNQNITTFLRQSWKSEALDNTTRWDSEIKFEASKISNLVWVSLECICCSFIMVQFTHQGHV